MKCILLIKYYGNVTRNMLPLHPSYPIPYILAQVAKF
jgi:hypothetical protein